MRIAATEPTVTQSHFLLTLTALVLIAAAPSMAQTVVFDQGPTTGTKEAGCWVNQTGDQNFAPLHHPRPRRRSNRPVQRSGLHNPERGRR